MTTPNVMARRIVGLVSYQACAEIHCAHTYQSLGYLSLHLSFSSLCHLLSSVLLNILSLSLSVCPFFHFSLSLPSSISLPLSLFSNFSPGQKGTRVGHAQAVWVTVIYASPPVIQGGRLASCLSGTYGGQSTSDPARVVDVLAALVKDMDAVVAAIQGGRCASYFQ